MVIQPGGKFYIGAWHPFVYIVIPLKYRGPAKNFTCRRMTMRMQQIGSFPSGRLLLIVALALSTASVGLGQPVEDCTGADLSGSAVLPFNGSFTPASFNFNMSGAGCFPPPFGLDSVVCFTPTNSCTVDFSCSFPSSQRVEVNVRDMGAGGACTTSAGPCVASDGVDAGVGNDATSPLSLIGVALTAGNHYCFVCTTSDQVPSVPQTFDITGAGCGALPATLQRFGVE